MKLGNGSLSQAQRAAFLVIVAEYAQRAEGGGWRTPIKRVTSRQVQGAIKHANGLRHAASAGVVDKTLVPVLDRTIDQLKLYRRKRGRGRTPARQFLDDLAEELLRTAGWCSPMGLMRLAELMGVPCIDERQAQRICDAARAQEAAWEATQAALHRLAAKYPGDN